MSKKVNLDKVEEEIYAKRQTVRYDVRDMTVEMLAEKYQKSLNENEVEFNSIYIPEYQRDFTWDKDRQAKLIESIILGLPVPFIFVAENKDGRWEIVDGSQRIRTIHSFVNNELMLDHLKSIPSLNGYIFKELEPTRQIKFLNTALRMIILSEETTDEAKKDMFERINRGSDLLKPMEKRKGIYTGKFCSFIYKYCKDNHEFNKLTPIDKWLENRQEREELLLRFFAIIDEKAYIRGIDKGVALFLDEYLEKKNNEMINLDKNDSAKYLDDYIKRINTVVDFVNKYFPYGFRHTHNPQTKRSVFESISVGVWLALQHNKGKACLDKEEVQKVLNGKEFKRYTNVANESHKKAKLKGRIGIIYKMITGRDL